MQQRAGITNLRQCEVKTKRGARQSKSSSVSDNDPFALPKRIRQRVRECVKHTEQSKADIVYLWIHVSESGIGHPDNAKNAEAPLRLEEWLNVVDEAAAFGVTWVVITLHAPFAQFPDIWEIARWAQDTHGMRVGLHTNNEELREAEVEAIKGLDLKKTRLFVRRDIMDRLKYLEAAGIGLAPSDPQPYGHKPDCQGPAKMVFVDPQGVLYTCGLVEGNDTYRLGTIHENTFDKILRDPSLPHKLPDSIHRVSKGCDGCPSLIANFMAFEAENPS